MRLPSLCCRRLLASIPWTVCFVVLGLVLRSYHYFRDPSMWHDEAAVVLNVMRKSFLDLLGPLLYTQAAPPLFLWLERLMFLCLGDATYALRLPSFLASCAGLVGIVLAARQLLPASAVPWLALLFACSDNLLWHNCEAKPYALDVFAGVVVLCLFAVGRERSPRWNCVTGMVLSPVLLGLSYPASFLVGGWALSWLPAVIRERRVSTWLWYGGLLGVQASVFFLLLSGPIQAQQNEELLRWWRHTFPDWHRPWTVPVWLVWRSIEVVRYDNEPLGSLLFPVAIVGGVALWRSGRRQAVACLVLPLILAALAGMLHRYPYGGFRLVAFAAPLTLTLTAVGMPCALAWLRDWCRAGAVLLLAVALFSLGQSFYRMYWPWPRPDAAHASAYVQTHCMADEVVAGTVWEHEYYCRDLGEKYRYWGTNLSQCSRRVWLLASGKTPAKRSEYVDEALMHGEWRILRQVEFRRLTVYHLEHRDVSARAEPPPLPSGEQSEPPHNHP